MKNYKILAITEEGYDAGFLLAGCDVETVKNENEMFSILEKYSISKIYGIIIVDAEIFYKIPERKRREFEEMLIPSIVPIYFKMKDRKTISEELRESVRRILGYSIRIKE
jgi:vacuolar-type H+-ATPase subunit F/Vma7